MKGKGDPMKMLYVLSVFWLVGCGPAARGINQEAEIQCREFVDVNYCQKVALCDPSTSVADCMSLASLVLDCSTVTAVNGNFASCKTDLAAETCPVFWDGTNINQPASCQHIFVR